MRILLVSYFFPPFNEIGAVRAGKIAKYLHRAGHDVRVISAAGQAQPGSLRLEIPEEQVSYTRWVSPAKPGSRSNGSGYATSQAAGPGRLKRILKGVRKVGASTLAFPDGQIGWYPYARACGNALIEEWRPDVIYASAKPFTALLVARSLARKHGIPWVAELRDLWVDNQTYAHPAVRRKIEERLERRVLSDASGIVTVSEPLAETLRAKYDVPVRVVTNGFDPEDFAPPDSVPFRDGAIQIAYTGRIYPGKQNLVPFFEALKRLGPLATSVKVVFHGQHLDEARRLVHQTGVGEYVQINGPVPYADALRMQSEADILLLLLWADRSERGVFTGKLFEYLGARRPILAVGPCENVAAELIRDRNAGLVSEDPDEIVVQLREWIATKQAVGQIAPLGPDVAAGLSRESQAAEIVSFIGDLTGPESRAEVLPTGTFDNVGQTSYR